MLHRCYTGIYKRDIVFSDLLECLLFPCHYYCYYILFLLNVLLTYELIYVNYTFLFLSVSSDIIRGPQHWYIAMFLFVPKL